MPRAKSDTIFSRNNRPFDAEPIAFQIRMSNIGLLWAIGFSNPED
jgi:hypothetical protein